MHRIEESHRVSRVDPATPCDMSGATSESSERQHPHHYHHHYHIIGAESSSTSKRFHLPGHPDRSLDSIKGYTRSTEHWSLRHYILHTSTTFNYTAAEALDNTHYRVTLARTDRVLHDVADADFFLLHPLFG